MPSKKSKKSDSSTTSNQKDDSLESLPTREPPYFRLTGRHLQRHKQALYCLSWSTDIHVDSEGDRYQYLATCGHNTLSLYEVEMDQPRGYFGVKQSYKDEDKDEQFYACAFAGRSQFLTNSMSNSGFDPSSSGRSDVGTDWDDSNRSNKSSSNGDVEMDDSRNIDDKDPILIGLENFSATNYLRQSEADSSSLVGPQLVCVAGASTFIKVIDPIQKKQIGILRGHANDIYDLKASPTDENLLLSASVDESIRLWNLRTFACVAIFAGHHGHNEGVLSLSWHSDGERFASSGVDKSIRLWNLNDGKVKEALQASTSLNSPHDRQSFHPAMPQFPYFVTHKVHINFVDCVQFIGDMLLSKSTYNSIILWMPILPKGSGPTSSFGAAAYCPPSDVMTLRTFELHQCHIWFVRFAMDTKGTRLAVGNIDGQVDIWDIDSCQERPSQRLKAVANSTVRTLAFNPSGNILVTCSDNGQVTKWNEWRS